MSRTRFRLVLTAALLLAACSEDATDPLTSAQMEIVSGDSQTGGVGASLAEPVVVRVLDASGKPITGARVQWQVVEGGGSVDSVSTATDGDGKATVSWTLGVDVGPQTLIADAGSASTNIRATGVLRFVAVAAGWQHTCALGSNALAYCWGSNSHGQLGDGGITSRSQPKAVVQKLRFVALAAGWTHTCGITVAGEVFCWGENIIGALGSPGPDAQTPRHIALYESFTSLSAGYHHTCGTTEAGTAYCWGVNDRGQLGTSATVPACPLSFIQTCTPIPQRVNATSQLKSVTADEFHTCALATTGAAYCWGWNSSGELGLGSSADVVMTTPQAVVGGGSMASIVAGVRHTCAVGTDGRAICWGRNGTGELGVPPGTPSSAPLAVNTALRFKQIGTGDMHTCALGTDDRVYCWGNLAGNGTDQVSSTPLMSTVAPSKWIGVGYQHACAVAVNGEVWCWGSNSAGQLGVSGVTRSNTPIKVQAVGE